MGEDAFLVAALLRRPEDGVVGGEFSILGKVSLAALGVKWFSVSIALSAFILCELDVRLWRFM